MHQTMRDELLAMAEADERAREVMLCAPPESILVARDVVRTLDRYNTTQLSQIIEAIGWPGASMVGADGAHAAWYLAQHADHDRAFQRRCLELLWAAVEKGEAVSADHAYLEDRVRLAEGRPQRYGTQFELRGGRVLLRPTEHPEELDARRATVGLPPFLEYQSDIKERLREENDEPSARD